MLVEIPERLEAALKAQAIALGMSTDGYIREVLERELSTASQPEENSHPLKTSYGILAKYGPAPSAEEIDENRAEMFRNFGASF